MGRLGCLPKLTQVRTDWLNREGLWPRFSSTIVLAFSPYLPFPFPPFSSSLSSFFLLLSFLSHPTLFLPFLSFFESRFYCAAQVGLQPAPIQLPQPFKSWDYRNAYHSKLFRLTLGLYHILVLPYGLRLAAVLGLCRAELQTLQHTPQADCEAWRPMLPSAAFWMIIEAAFGESLSFPEVGGDKLTTQIVSRCCLDFSEKIMKLPPFLSPCLDKD